MDVSVGAQALRDPSFPRASRYDTDWILDNALGPHPLWFAESLCDALRPEPGMRVLDLGCGLGITSVFLAREFGVHVWACDSGVPASTIRRTARGSGVEHLIQPVRADARSLPFDEGFFDAIISVDAYHYFGLDPSTLDTMGRLLRHGGQLGVTSPGLTRDFGDRPPPSWLEQYWSPAYDPFHSASWWQRLWATSRLMELDVCDDVPAAATLWSRWHKTILHEKDLGVGRDWVEQELAMLNADAGRTLTWVRLIAHRNDRKR